jgi:phosphoribosylformylglycinamidine synthase subunit PurQ / glutaminase
VAEAIEMVKTPKVIILRTAGTNCDMETAHAFTVCGAEVDLVHVNELERSEKSLGDYHILAIPGGFTYGDDIASGKILANEIKYKLGGELRKFIEKGKLVIGICNGFQVLVKAGILPGIESDNEATLSFNDSGKFEDRWTYLETTGKCEWTKKMKKIIYLPIAHGEGKFMPRDKKILNLLKRKKQVVFKYHKFNPNGSIGDIAGICDPTGRVLGMMPHPERHMLGTQHPRWTREGLKKFGDGLAIFKNGVEYIKKNL